MADKEEFIILANGMKVQVSILDGQKQKEKEAERPSRMVPQSSESLRKGESRVIAESKQLATLPSGKSEDPSYGIQKKMVAVPDNNSPIQQKKVEVKQMPKSKKHKNIWTRKKDTTLAERIEVGCYMKVPPYGRSFKVISINTGGFFLDIPNKPTYYATYSYAIDHYFIVVPKSHIETLKRESRHPSEIATMLLMHPITESKIVIKASGYNQQDPRHMKKMLVPGIFTELQWVQWLKRFALVQYSEKDQIKVVNKQTNSPKPKIQQLGAARKLPEDAKKKIDSVKIMGQERKNNQKHSIKPQDFMVKVQTFNCSNKRHTLRSIQAEVIYRSYNSNDLTVKLIPAGYCEQCKCYYILSSIYEEYSFFMKNALCDIVNEHDLPKFLQERSMQTTHWRLQSDYKKCGYSVSQAQNLRDHERIGILENIIAYKIHSRQEVMSFINWLIVFNKSNPQQHHAIQKWKSDLLEVANRKD